MTHFENPIRLVKELKGAALSIMVLLSWSNTPVTREWLEVHSGYSDKPVSKALFYLREQGFLVKGAGGWMLASGARQLPLPLEQVGEETPPSPPDTGGSQEVLVSEVVDNGYPVDNLVETVDKVSDEAELVDLEKPQTAEDPEEIRNFSVKNRNFSENGLVSYLVNNDSESKESINKLVKGEKIGKIPKLDPEVRLVARCLARYGISINTRTRRLLTRITCDDILIVANELEQENKTGETGLFVVRLEQRAAVGKGGFQTAPLPRSRDTDHRRYRRSMVRFGLLDPEEAGFDPDREWDDGLDPEGG